MEEIVVQMLGGPEDGALIRMPGGSTVLKVPMPNYDHGPVEGGPDKTLGLTIAVVPVRRRRNGLYYADWYSADIIDINLKEKGEEQ